MSKQLITPVQKRFSDVDSFMHVNNIWQQSYFDMGKTQFYTQVLGITGFLLLQRKQVSLPFLFLQELSQSHKLPLLLHCFPCLPLPQSP